MSDNFLEVAEAVEEIMQGTKSVVSGYEKLARTLQAGLEASRKREKAAVEEGSVAKAELVLYRQRVQVLDRICGHVEHFRCTLERAMFPGIRERVAPIEDPAERFVVAAGLMLEEIPLPPEVWEALRREALDRVDAHLEKYPVLRPLRSALVFRLFSRLRREFDRRRGYLVPNARRDQAFRFVRTYPLPEPGSMRPLQLQLVAARGRLGLSTAGAARAIGVTRGTYVRWEMGDAEPHCRYEAAVSAFLERAGFSAGRVVALAGLERASDPARLAALRRRAGLSQREAAVRAGMPPYTVSRLERGRAVRGGRAFEARLSALYEILLDGGEAAAGV